MPISRHRPVSAYTSYKSVPFWAARLLHKERLEKRLDRAIDSLRDLQRLGQKRKLNRHERLAAASLARRVSRAQYGRYHAIKPKV